MMFLAQENTQKVCLKQKIHNFSPILAAFIEINEDIKFVKSEDELGNPFFEKVIDPNCCALSQGT